jgi:hypothetical protein
MDNPKDFSSKVFNDYCMALGVKVEHLLPYVHAQNGLAKSLVKRIELITRPFTNDMLGTCFLACCI